MTYFFYSGFRVQGSGGGFAAKKEANPASLRSAAPSKGRGSRGCSLLPLEGGAPKGRRLEGESGIPDALPSPMGKAAKRGCRYPQHTAFPSRGRCPEGADRVALRYIPHCSITASMPLLPSALPPKGEARRYVTNDFLNLIALPMRRRLIWRRLRREYMGRCPKSGIQVTSHQSLATNP